MRLPRENMIFIDRLHRSRSLDQSDSTHGLALISLIISPSSHSHQNKSSIPKTSPIENLLAKVGLNGNVVVHAIAGSSCDLRESQKRRGSRGAKSVQSSSKAEAASDDDSVAANATSTAFSGRHSHSTSDLHSLTPPHHGTSAASGANSACGQLAEKGESAFSSPSVSSEYIAVSGSRPGICLARGSRGLNLHGE